MTTDSRVDKIWMRVGQLGVLVGLVVGIIAIYDWLRPDGVSIRAAVASHPYEPSPTTGESQRLPAFGQSYTEMILENDGSRRASDVVVRLPRADGIARISSSEFSDRIVEFSELVEIGAMNPGAEVSVTVWSDFESDRLWGKGPTVTHSTGIIEPTVTRHTEGLLDAVHHHGSLWTSMALSAVLAFAVMGLLSVVLVRHLTFRFAVTKDEPDDT